MINPFDVFTAKRVRLTLPWETGFAGLVLSRSGSDGWANCNALLDPSWENSFVRAALVTMPTVLGTEEDGKLIESLDDELTPAFKSIGRTRIALPWSKKVDALRQIAMERWKLIVLDSPAGSQLGIQLHEASKSQFAQERTEAILQDVFATKATRTLEARSGSLLMFTHWRRTLPLFRGILPFVEDDCYSYLTALRVGNAPATRGRRFMESVGFAHGLIGASGATEVLQSRRCRGAAARSMTTKGPHTQRDPLLAVQVQALERGVFELCSEEDRIMSGNTVALLHVRGRFSDVYHCQSEPFMDGIFFEVPVLDTKVSRRDKKRKCLPLVGLSRGLSGLPWAEEWLRLRKAHGLDATNGPMMFAITAGGNWTGARLRSQEAMTWIRGLLIKLKVPIVPGQLFGTHSLKCTALSWMAKAGCRLEHRNMLGYHSSGAAESSLLYARAAYAGPLRALHKLFIHIRENRFLPDSTRSGSWCLDHRNEVGQEEDESELDFSGDSVNNQGASSSKNIPGIDFDAVSVVDCCSDQEGEYYRNSVDEPQAGEDDEDDGFGTGSNDLFQCEACSINNIARNAIFICDECDDKGCTHCMIVQTIDGRLLCFNCIENDNLAKQARLGEVCATVPDSDSSDSEGSESSNSEVENAAVELAVEAVVEAGGGRRPAKNPDDFVIQHKQLKTLHMLRRSDDTVQRLACGRVLSDKFEVLHVIPLFDWPKCGVCYGSKSR